MKLDRLVEFLHEEKSYANCVGQDLHTGGSLEKDNLNNKWK